MPAVLTAQAWGKVAPAFLYSFEHIGKKSSGTNFLSQLSLVGSQKRDGKVSHGDELGYLFDARDLFGKAIPGSHVRIIRIVLVSLSSCASFTAY